MLILIMAKTLLPKRSKKLSGYVPAKSDFFCKMTRWDIRHLKLSVCKNLQKFVSYQAKNVISILDTADLITPKSVEYWFYTVFLFSVPVSYGIGFVFAKFLQITRF